MSSIWITGDCHSDMSRFQPDIFFEQEEMDGTQDENFMIVCGDFGVCWDYRGSNLAEEMKLDFLEERPFTTLFVDGNHECFERLNAYPEEEWHGGKVHKLSPHVIHLMRGEVFDVLGKKILAFGGAKSHDIKDGILEPDDPRIIDFRMNHKQFRINHQTWWKEEIANDKEMINCKKNLARNDNYINYVITHDAPASLLPFINRYFKSDENSRFLENSIRQVAMYDKWFFGHYHRNQDFNGKELCLFEQMIRIY